MCISHITHNFQNSQDFVNHVAEEVIKHLKPLLQKLHSTTPEMRFHSKKDTAKILGIALSNLSEKTKDGTITASRLGARVLYSDADIANALTKIRTV